MRNEAKFTSLSKKKRVYEHMELCGLWQSPDLAQDDVTVVPPGGVSYGDFFRRQEPAALQKNRTGCWKNGG